MDSLLTKAVAAACDSVTGHRLANEYIRTGWAQTAQILVAVISILAAGAAIFGICALVYKLVSERH